MRKALQALTLTTDSYGLDTHEWQEQQFKCSVKCAKMEVFKDAFIELCLSLSKIKLGCQQKCFTPLCFKIVLFFEL